MTITKKKININGKIPPLHKHLINYILYNHDSNLKLQIIYII